MAVAVSIEVGDGALLVVHRADEVDADRLRGAGERLRAAAHPGVVAVRWSRPIPSGWELATDHAGRPLTADGSVPLARVAAICAEVAATLAALHERGVVHGRLQLGRVLVGPGGNAVLCGFGPGAAAGEGGTEADVAGLGAILAALTAAADDPPRDAAATTLRSIAARAQAEPPSRRPSARRLAAELRAVAGAPPSRRVGTRSRRVAAGGLAVVGATLAAAVALGGDGSPTAPGARRAPVANAADRPSTTTTALGEPPCVARQGAPVLAAACGQRAVVEGSAVIVDGHRTVVGQHGDVVVVADWACEGELRPAVLRPSTGEVLVLTEPGPSGGRSVASAARVPGGTDLLAGVDAAGCPVPLVADGSGPPTPVTGSTGGEAEG